LRRDDPRVEKVDLAVETGLPAAAATVLAALAPLVTERRLERLRTVAAGRLTSVAPVLEDIADPHNASAILRSADAFGIQRVHVIPSPAGFHASRQISKGSHSWLDLYRHGDAARCAAALKASGHRIFVASMEGTVTPRELAREPKVAVVFGNEHRGPSSGMREHADGTYAIPMRGFVESLNVSVAAAITLHAATAEREGELTPEERDALVARWLLQTVRDAERIVRDHVAAHGQE
jgi:tRNA (guanosine-2'-O-)-methyltransferase